MLAQYILAGVAALFPGATALRLADGRSAWHPQVRVRLLLGAIFSVVSAWLFSNG